VPGLPNLAEFDYVDRVNRAIDYVTRNLDQPLRLEEVAKAACFSSYHFHRIFRTLMGETLAAFVKRVRLERAVYLLSHRNGASLTEIALACGFSSSSDFSRSFRGQYRVAPSRFDVEKFRLSGRKAMQVSLTPPGERHRLRRLPAGKNPDGFAVTLRKLPARRVAYSRVHRPYEGELRALHWLYLTWLPSSGYAPAHQPAFEAWNGRPFAHGMEHFELRAQLPVVPASVPL
jgi:AraC family transcriptional regulator